MRRIAATTALLLTTLAGMGPANAQEGEGFVPLVEGTDAGQFELVGIDEGTISIGEDGEIALTGKPNGYFATKTPYDNYILRFEWMYERPEDLEDDADFDGNSGLLVHIDGEAKVWPKCVEVQMMNADAGRLLGVSGGKIESRQPAEARARALASALKPVGQWNAFEVTCKDGAVSCSLNGTQIDTGVGASPAAGTIGWQSEGRPLRLRKLEIKPTE